MAGGFDLGLTFGDPIYPFPLVSFNAYILFYLNVLSFFKFKIIKIKVQCAIKSIFKYYYSIYPFDLF